MSKTSFYCLNEDSPIEVETIREAPCDHRMGRIEQIGDFSGYEPEFICTDCRQVLTLWQAKKAKEAAYAADHS